MGTTTTRIRRVAKPRRKPTTDEPTLLERSLAGGMLVGGSVAAGAASGSSALASAAAAAAGMALPYAEIVAHRVFDEFRADARARADRMLAEADKELGGGGPSKLADLTGRSEQTRQVTAIAVDAAARTFWPPKVVAIGRALASGLMSADDTQIDTQPFIMAALAELEFPQASLLELLVCHWPMTTKEGVVAAPFTSAPNPWTAGQRIWLPSEMAAVRPKLRPVLPSLLGTLQRHGLTVQSDNPSDPFGRTGRTMQQRFLSDRASQQGTWANLETIAGYGPAGSWLPTELGQEVINALLAAGAELAA